MSQKKIKSKSKKKQIRVLSKKNLIKKFFVILLFTFITSSISYFIINNKDVERTEKTSNSTENKKELFQTNNENKLFQEKNPQQYFDELAKINEKFEEYTDEFDNDIIEKEQETQLNEKIHQKIEEIKEDKKVEEIKQQIKEDKKIDKKEIVKKETSPILDDKNIITQKDTYKYDKSNKPKIAILIDDVSTQKQKDTILSMGYKINMAFLPPTNAHPNSAKIAQDVSFHMIHFPMQASSKFKGEEPETLKITDSYETIEKRVRLLRDWYPNAIYTNNHTGSVFTENEEAMDKLFRALKKHNFIFVDSRTSNKSVAKKYAKKYDMPYIVRNTFIDNDLDYNKIQAQLKKAIEIAKTNGYSIAIGHPHDVTLKVLRESKHLLKDVEPIFINKLPYL
jgi:polysaccharide deacetylase 2 family uncharacterized protein YibQ